MAIKVSIVEDDAGVRESLSILVNGVSGFHCISKFANGEVASKMIPLNWPDVVLMDINMPKLSGIECTAHLKALNPRLQIIMLTVYEDNEQIFDSLAAGASGYLSKETPPSEVLEAISDVVRGGSPMSSQIARKVVQYFQRKQRSVDDTENLSQREEEILGYLAKGYRYKEIAEALSISALTVRSHLHRIYEKLHVRSRTEAVVKYLGRS